MKKTVFIPILVIIVLLSIYNISYGASIDNIMAGADNFLNAGQTGSHIGFSQDGVKATSDLIYNILLTIGVIAAVIVAAFLGIKFIVSSVEEQAKIKESLVPFVIGCVIIFGAFGIWKVVANIADNVTSTSPDLPNLTDDQIDYMEYQRGYSDGQSYQASHNDEDIDKEVKTTEANVKKYPKNKYYQGYLQGLQY